MEDNPTEVLRTLDHELDHEVSLVLYGRAALFLGFPNSLADFGTTQDVDGIIRSAQLPALLADDSFWEAQERTNLALESRGLYITHLFSEDQVFLRPDWEKHIIPITRPATRWLRLFRPHSLDLILTKMMRGDDPQDMEDIAFIMSQGEITPAEMEIAFLQVRIPDIQELREAFHRALPVVRKILLQSLPD
jgi:hypothetical protein